MKPNRLVDIFAAFICWSACHQRTECTCDEAKAGKRLAFADHDVHYQVHGQGPVTLVFIHGWTASLQNWKHQLDAFPDARVVAVDLPGHGRSSRRPDTSYTMELFADTVRAVLEAERIDRAFFFGHSMGFAVVEVIASKYPQLCAGIGSIDGVHFEVPADEAGQERWRRETEAMAAAMTTEEARDGFLNMLLRPDTPPILREEVLRASRTVPLAIGRAMIAGAVADRRYWLPKKVEIPCLAVYSPAYQLPPDYRDDFARTFPRVEYHEVRDVSHFFMLEIPYRLNQMIADFVAQHQGDVSNVGG